MPFRNKNSTKMGGTGFKRFGATAQTFDQLITALSPSAWWKLADTVGTTSPVDSSGHGYTGTATGTTFGVAGSPLASPNTAVSLTNGSITAANPLGLSPTGCSLLAIFKTTSASANMGLNTLETSGGNGYVDLTMQAGTIRFECGGGGSPTDISSPLTYDDGNWHFTVLTYDGTSLRGYVDGSLVVGPTTVTTPLAFGIAPSVTLGNTLFAQPFVGTLQECVDFNFALSPAQISQLAAA